MPRFGRQREHPEQPTQDVATFRRPRHRFNARRVNCKERRRHRRRCQPTSASLQHQHQHDRRHRVNEQAHQVMPGRIEPEERDIKHLRERGQRVPVAHVNAGERGRQACDSEPAAHERIFRDVLWIVVGDERIAHDPAKRGQRQQRECDRSRKRTSAFGALCGLLFGCNRIESRMAKRGTHRREESIKNKGRRQASAAFGIGMDSTAGSGAVPSATEQPEPAERQQGERSGFGNRVHRDVIEQPEEQAVSVRVG